MNTTKPWMNGSKWKGINNMKAPLKGYFERFVKTLNQEGFTDEEIANAMLDYVDKVRENHWKINPDENE